MNNNILSQELGSISAIEKRVISQTYIWMCLGLALTGFIAYYAAHSPFVNFVAQNRWVFWALIIGQVGLVISLSGFINRIAAPTAIVLFFLYAALNGLTLFTIFLAFSTSSIASAFFVTAGTFAVMSVYGLVTKQDLTAVGNILFMGLIGIVIASVVNLFLGSSMLDLIISIIGVIVFTGLIGYDSQKIKMMASRVTDNEAEMKVSVIGALSLYLDFINLFIMLLRIFGGSRSSE